MSFISTQTYTKSASTTVWHTDTMPWPSDLNDLVQATNLIRQYNAEWSASFNYDKTSYRNTLVFPSPEAHALFRAEPWVMAKQSFIEDWIRDNQITVTGSAT